MVCTPAFAFTPAEQRTMGCALRSQFPTPRVEDGCSYRYLNHSTTRIPRLWSWPVIGSSDRTNLTMGDELPDCKAPTDYGCLVKGACLRAIFIMKIAGDGYVLGFNSRNCKLKPIAKVSGVFGHEFKS